MAIPKTKRSLDIRFLSVVNSNSDQECPSQQSAGSKKLGYTAEQGFKILYEKYFKALCLYASKIVEDTQLAEDIVSDVFTSLMLHGDFNTTPEARDQLFAAVEAMCIDHVKKQQVIANGLAAFDHITPLEEAEIESELTALIYDELCNLPPQRQKIIVQLYMKGLSSEQVAKKMKLSRQTVLNQKIRALKILRDKIMRRLFS